MIETSKYEIHGLIIKYGIISFISLIEDYVKIEDYENANIIKAYIDEANQDLNINLPTDINDFSVDDWIKEINKLGFKGDIARNNLWIYKSQVKSALFL